MHFFPNVTFHRTCFSSIFSSLPSPLSPCSYHATSIDTVSHSAITCTTRRAFPSVLPFPADAAAYIVHTYWPSPESIRRKQRTVPVVAVTPSHPVFPVKRHNHYDHTDDYQRYQRPQPRPRDLELLLPDSEYDIDCQVAFTVRPQLNTQNSTTRNNKQPWCFFKVDQTLGLRSSFPSGSCSNRPHINHQRQQQTQHQPAGSCQPFVSPQNDQTSERLPIRVSFQPRVYPSK